MSRRLIHVVISLGVAGVLASAGSASAEEIADRGLGARLGVATGGSTTPGGARVEGIYLYRLSDRDWFDGRGAFTVGGGGAACFRDRDNAVACNHSALEGSAGMFAATIRRNFAGRDAFAPFARVGIGAAIVRFGADELTGIAIPVIAGGGVMARVSDLVTVGGEANLEIGPSFLGRGVGAQLHTGFVVGVSVGFQLK